jgi:hypothetical protein
VLTKPGEVGDFFALVSMNSPNHTDSSAQFIWFDKILKLNHKVVVVVERCMDYNI